MASLTHIEGFCSLFRIFHIIHSHKLSIRVSLALALAQKGLSVNQLPIVAICEHLISLQAHSLIVDVMRMHAHPTC